MRKYLSLYAKILMPFLDNEIHDADIVSYTSMFMQNVSSFLARILKELNPNITIIMGGANCEHTIGNLTGNFVLLTPNKSIMQVPEIIEVKNHLDTIKSKGLLSEWELPYENILTRRSAAIFFLTPKDDSALSKIWKELDKYSNFSFRKNAEKKLSQLEYRITFSMEEKKKNEESLSN